MPVSSLLLAGMLTVAVGSGGIVSMSSFQTSSATGETRSVSGVREVVFSMPGTLIITQGTNESLVIDGDSSVSHLIVTRMSGSRLVIERSDGNASGASVTIRLTVNDVASIEQTGEGHIEADGLTSGLLKLVTRGAGDVRIDGLAVDSLRVATYGVGAIDLSGSATQQDVEMYGAGVYRADRLVSSDTTVELRGAGRVTVQSTNTLDARIWGSGVIEYSGNPRVSQDVSGSGRVTHRG